MRNGLLRRAATVLILLSAPALSGVCEAGPLGKAVARGTAKSAKRAISAKLAGLLARDARRDSLRRAMPLSRSRSVFRYTTRARAAVEARRGISVGHHLTSRAGPGRPPSGARAAKVLGLPRRAERRETVYLSKGTLVKSAKVIGGVRSKGELVTGQRLPPGVIKKILPLR